MKMLAWAAAIGAVSLLTSCAEHHQNRSVEAAPATASGGNLGSLVSALAPGKLTYKPNNPGGIFDRGTQNDIDYIGATVLLRGKIKDKETVVELTLAPDGTMRSVAAVQAAIPVYDWNGTTATLDPNIPGNSFKAPEPPSREAPTQVSYYHVIEPSPSACTQSVLSAYNEAGYGIDWCKVQATGSTRKKNYNYIFANGDAVLVMTMIFDCNNAADKAAMPTVVKNSC